MIATLFVNPIPLTPTQVFFMLLPLLVATAVVYKTVRTRDLRLLVKEVGVLVVYMVAGLAALGTGLWAIQQFWP